ncbi:MAG: hypothetical protein HYX92_11735 [Chloroflexi bacterium]|nr:hypothetical protein [Chloroflexota bacterium]
MVATDQPSVDFLMLADRAEAINGKIYMMGGGWDRLYVPDFAQHQSISIATGILVPWNATNRTHSLALRVETQDATELAALGLNFNAGRPPLLGQGESQRVVLAFQLSIRLPAPGTYVVKALVNDAESKRTVFHAQALPKPPATMAPPAR